MAREGQICPTNSKLSKICPNQCKTNIFLFAFLESLGNFMNCHRHFEKFIIFLPKILCFRFCRADLPFPGQDRVTLETFKEEEKFI